MLFLYFFEFFCYFFGIIYYALGRNETERQYLFSFFLGLFQPIPALNDAILAFFNFLNFFAILNSPSGWDGTKRYFFIFSLSLPFPNYFRLK